MKAKKNYLPILISVIGIGLGLLSVWAVIHSVQLIKYSTPTLPPSGPGLLEQLQRGNIDISNAKNYLSEDPAYQELGWKVLQVLNGRRLAGNPVDLQVINGKYKQLLGYSEDEYIRPSLYDELAKIEEAIFEAWKVYNPSTQNISSFENILVSDSP